MSYAYEFARYLRGTAAGRMPPKPRERNFPDWVRAAMAGALTALAVAISLFVLFPAVLDLMGGQ